MTWITALGEKVTDKVVLCQFQEGSRGGMGHLRPSPHPRKLVSAFSVTYNRQKTGISCAVQAQEF